MKTVFYAQPYTIEANGFYFSTTDDFKAGISACRTRFGDPVEEYEIQFIDGELIDARLFEALSIGQATVIAFINKVEAWSEDDKHHLSCSSRDVI